MEQGIRRCGDTDLGRASEVSMFLENMSLLANQCGRLLRDAELLEAKLGKIDGAEDFGAHMINIVKAKQVAS